MEEWLKPVTRVRHGAVRFESAGAVIWADPFRVRGSDNDAALVAVTHAHGDHYSPRDIKKVMNEDTLFLAGADVAARLEAELGVAPRRITVMRTGGRYAPLAGAEVTALPAENANHPAGSGFGLLLSFAGVRYYLSGDTDTLCPNAACDVLFCVCDGRYNMPDYLNSAPAQILAMNPRPGLVVPYHYENAGEGGHGQKLADKLNALGVRAVVCS